MSRLVIWGAGELGGRVAALWDGPVEAFTQSEARHAALAQIGARPRLGSPVEALKADDTLLLALPGTDRQTIAVAALRDRPPPRRIVLISSTGYYGTAHGLVSEEAHPGRGPRALRVAATEELFRQWAGDAGVILRCGGLYRPGRGPMSALARTQKVPVGPPDKTLALVHYADAAAATHAALAHPDPQDVYTVVTPPCPSREAFYLAACVLLDLKLPRFGRRLKKPPAEYDVGRLRADLLPSPAHPRWQEALLLA